MTTRRTRASRALLAVGAAGGLAVAFGGGSPATAQETAQPTAPAKTISMRSTAKRLYFSGATSVKSGQSLRIRNLTDPKQHGPHTFSLVAANALPKGRKAMQQCFTPGKICMTIAMAHQLNPETEDVGLHDVEVGKAGWDKRFSRTAKSGDSWYSDAKGEETTRPVSAKAGTVLRYVCAVHPEMQGKIRVTR